MGAWTGCVAWLIMKTIFNYIILLSRGEINHSE